MGGDGATTGRSKFVEIRRVDGPQSLADEDRVAVEEPLEIRLGFRDGDRRTEEAVAITMRTPGHDEELATGFLFTEGIVRISETIIETWFRGPPVPGNSDLHNVIRVDLADDASVDFERLRRNFYTTSSCGVCGKASLDALRSQSAHEEALRASDFCIATDDLNGLGSKLRKQQQVFGETGGLHASGLFDASGSIAMVREDVGRHNAMDKLVGRLFLDGNIPASDHGVIVSGRASFELVQKVAMAGIPVMAAVGAPSSLAVDVAREFGVTLVGFLRDGRFNVYTGDERIRSRVTDASR